MLVCRVKICDLVVSPVLAELLQLPISWSATNGQEADARPNDAAAAAAAVAAGTADNEASWFAPATAAHLVDLFHSLDSGGLGLTPADLIRRGFT